MFVRKRGEILVGIGEVGTNKFSVAELEALLRFCNRKPSVVSGLPHCYNSSPKPLYFQRIYNPYFKLANSSGDRIGAMYAMFFVFDSIRPDKEFLWLVLV